KTPGVVGAHECPCFARVALADLGSPVSAPVEQHVNLASRVTTHDHGLEAESARHEVPGTWNLTFMSEEHPAPVIDSLHLFREDRWVGVNGSMDAPIQDEHVVIARWRFDCC